jgi:predicted O-linked N-acetylglucosamine transferase (SPINDLY family)
MNTVERNAPCPCGSGRKYKKCCMGRMAPAPESRTAVPAADVAMTYHHALTLHGAGRLAEAAALYRSILERQPAHADALHMLGAAQLQAGQLQEARHSLEQAYRIRPRDPFICYNLGLVLQKLQRPQESLTCLERAIALKPDFADAHNQRGIALRDLHRPEAALESYRQALMYKPDDVELLNNLGNICHDLQRDPEALAYFDRALALRPDHGNSHNGRGMVLQNLDRYDEALDCFVRALKLQPDLIMARCNLAHALLHRGNVPEALALLQQVLQVQPDLMQAGHSRVFALNYLPQAMPADIYRAHRAFAQRCEEPLHPAWPVYGNERDPAKRLKVGYVSPDLRQHSVAYFLEPVLTQHDRTQVEVYAYYNNTVEDAVTARLRREVDHWVPCKGMSDAELAARIQADGIDLLIDLAGHTVGNRLLVFAHKPAPVQVSYLGYPATTGLQAMDWRLVTAETDPEGAEQWHSERLYRLPRSLWCYRPPATAGEVQGETPARTVGSITFGSMNNIAKVSDAAVATWSGILKRVPGSRLVLTNLPEGEGTTQVARRFVAQGITEERLVLQGKLSAEAYEAQLQKIDLGLDPYPYNGTTTTCQSLWMGIPVITLEGETSVSRSGYALLQTLGLEELIARDEGEYVEIATRLANDLDRLDALRSGMRSRFEASALRDETGFTREIEDAYRTMWRQWCATVEHV